MRDHTKRFTLKEWADDYVQKVIDLADECDVEIELEPVDKEEDLRWSKDDVHDVVDALVTICPENLSESQGGEGDDDAPFNDEFFEWLDGVPGDDSKPGGRWSQNVIDNIDKAIEKGCCSCCWELRLTLNVDFVGNTVPNPQFATLRTKEKCDATAEELGELFNTAFNEWLASIPPGIEGLTFTYLEADAIAGVSQDCETSFSPPIIES